MFDNAILILLVSETSAHQVILFDGDDPEVVSDFEHTIEDGLYELNRDPNFVSKTPQEQLDTFISELAAGRISRFVTSSFDDVINKEARALFLTKSLLNFISPADITAIAENQTLSFNLTVYN